MALCNRLFGYWGKAQAQPGSAVLWHPLVFHSVDVAAVASRALDARPDWLVWFAKQLNLEANACKQVLVWLLGLHDLGKFADNFQSKVPEIYSAQFPDRELVPGGERHDSLGYALWKQYARKLPTFAALDQGFDAMIACVCGHHGLPPKAVGTDDLNLAFRSAARADALHYATLWTEFCFPTGAPALGGVANKNDGWLAGLAVLCDWLGSNTDWFAYCAPDTAPDLASYWHLALQKADVAVREAKIVGSIAAPFAGAAAVLLSEDALRPMQRVALELALTSGPTSSPKLVIMEDSTGSGKTEAALLIVHRMMAAGLANGLYFALPSQATANSVFERCWKNLRRARSAIKPKMSLKPQAWA